MSERISAVLDRIEAQQALAVIEPATNALGFLQSIYRNRQVPLPVRLRAAIETLPFESPKLSATAVLYQDDFASRLERAIERSGRPPKLIEAKPIET